MLRWPLLPQELLPQGLLLLLLLPQGLLRLLFMCLW
jgi:hypothetical protein